MNTAYSQCCSQDSRLPKSEETRTRRCLADLKKVNTKDVNQDNQNEELQYSINAFKQNYYVYKESNIRLYLDIACNYPCTKTCHTNVNSGNALCI